MPPPPDIVNSMPPACQWRQTCNAHNPIQQILVVADHAICRDAMSHAAHLSCLSETLHSCGKVISTGSPSISQICFDHTNDDQCEDVRVRRNAARDCRSPAGRSGTAPGIHPTHTLDAVPLFGSNDPLQAGWRRNTVKMLSVQALRDVSVISFRIRLNLSTRVHCCCRAHGVAITLHNSFARASHR